MEYVDNSVDSAEDFFDPLTNRYTRAINISISIDLRSVVITDNCTGIPNIERTYRNIGDSNKKGQFTTNGQFGYGIYSFLALCQQLRISSKCSNAQAYTVLLEKDYFDVADIENATVPDPTPMDVDFDSGTQIILSKFTEKNPIDQESILKEVEFHFESILKRENIKISVSDYRNSGSPVRVCRPFDYNIYEGPTIEKQITQVVTRRRHARQGSDYVINLGNPIKVFLKVTPNDQLNRPPIITIKGRRVQEIRSISEFKSQHRSDIWGHPNITGFIDATNLLEPNIARIGFANTTTKKPFFDGLLALETEIQAALDSMITTVREKQFEKLESILQDTLAKLAKWDNINMRRAVGSGMEPSPISGTSGVAFEDGFGDRDQGGEGEKGDGPGVGLNPGDGQGPSEKEGLDAGGGSQEGDFNHPDPGLDDLELDGSGRSERRNSGFDIQFVNGEQIDAQTSKPVRSQLIDGSIRIFREHEDFLNRLDKRRHGEPVITQRLITYLAGEITVHYKDLVQNRKGQPVYNKALFTDLVDFIYRFEDMLKDLVNKDLSAI